MLNKFFIIIYISIVLLISSFTKAEIIESTVIELPISKIQFSSNDYALHIQGSLLTQCDENLRPEITIQDNEIHVAVLADTHEGCGLRIEGNYDLVFDIRTQLNSTSIMGDILEIHVPELAFKKQISFKHLSAAFPFSSVMITGVLHRADDQFFIELESGRLVNIKCADIINKLNSLNKYIAKEVQISGHSLNFRIPDMDLLTPQGEVSIDTILLSSINSTKF